MAENDNIYDVDSEHHKERLKRLRTDAIMNAKIYRDGHRGNSTVRKTELGKKIDEYIQELFDHEG